MLIIAHRGAKSLAPENTIIAAQTALNLGADMWETDIAVTSDENLILIHNDSLTDTTDVSKKFPKRAPWKVNTFTLDEIRSLDAGSWFIENDPHHQITSGNVTLDQQKSYQNIKIPTLLEALDFTQQNNWKVNLELKQHRFPVKDFSILDHFIATLEKVNISPRQFVVSSFNHEWLRDIQKRKPKYTVEALIGLPGDIKPLNWGNFEFKTYNVNLEQTSVTEIREVLSKGIKVNLYNLKETAKDVVPFIEAGVSGLITDFPQNMTLLKNVTIKNNS